MSCIEKSQTTTQKDRVLAAHRAGQSLRQIAAKEGISRRQVNIVLGRRVPKRSGRPKLPAKLSDAERKERRRQEYAQTYRTTAKVTHRSECGGNRTGWPAAYIAYRARRELLTRQRIEREGILLAVRGGKVRQPGDYAWLPCGGRVWRMGAKYKKGS